MTQEKQTLTMAMLLEAKKQLEKIKPIDEWEDFIWWCEYYNKKFNLGLEKEIGRPSPSSKEAASERESILNAVAIRNPSSAAEINALCEEMVANNQLPGEMV